MTARKQKEYNFTHITGHKRKVVKGTGAAVDTEDRVEAWLNDKTEDGWKLEQLHVQASSTVFVLMSR